MSLQIPPPTRPTMSNYGIAETPTGLLTWAWVSQQLTASRNYWICTTRPNGNPHAAPVWGVVIDDLVYFGTGSTSVKSKNIAHNAEVVVHLESGDDCVIIEGLAQAVTDQAILTKMAALYPTKYPEFKPTAAELAANANYVIQPKMVMAWQESDFPNTATRWVFAI